MSPFFIIFEPFLRLFGHSLAASFGFSGIAAVAVLPVQVIKMLSTYTAVSPDWIVFLQRIETAILYVDATLLLFVISIYSVYFVIEQWRALLKLIKEPKTPAESPAA